jgi:homoserine dehydrogenase
MHYGRGAGGMPTASAVVADLAGVAMGTAQRAFEQLRVWPDRCDPADQLPIEAVRSRYYLRVMAADQPGVLAQIAAILGHQDISISSVLQHEVPEGSDPADGVPVVITTHYAQEGGIRKALAHVNALDTIKAPSVCIGILEEHPEQVAAGEGLQDS